GRLVQDWERRLRRHDRCDHRALLLTAAQGDGEAVTDLLEPHLRERLFGARPRGVSTDSSGAKIAVHLLTRREVEERLPFLQHNRDEGPDWLRLVDDIKAEGPNLARCRDQEGRGDAQEGRLACAVPAEKGHSLAATDGEGHASERLDPRPHSTAVDLPDVPRLEGFLGHGPVQAKSAYKARFRVRSGPRFLGARRLVAAHHRECRLPLRFLLLLAHLDGHRDGPDVAERVLQLAVSFPP